MSDRLSPGIYEVGFGDSANISMPQYPPLKNRDNDNAYHIGSLGRMNERASVSPTANARHAVSLPKKIVVSFSFCIFHQGVLLAIALQSAFWSQGLLKDRIIDLLDVVGESCFPMFWPPCLTFGSTQSSLLGLAWTA